MPRIPNLKQVGFLPEVRDSHLNRCFTLPTWIKLTDTPRCVPHILTGNVCSLETQCLRQNKSATYLWQTATQSKLNCSRVHNSSQNCKTDHSGFHAYKTLRHVMQQKMKTHAKLMTADSKLRKLSSTSSNSVQSEIVQNSEIPRHLKTLLHSNLSLTALSKPLLHFSSQLSGGFQA